MCRTRLVVAACAMACHPSRAGQPNGAAGPAEEKVAAIARELDAIDHAVDLEQTTIEIREPQRFVEQLDTVLQLQAADGYWAAMVALRRATAIEPSFEDPAALRAEVAARRGKALLAFYDPQRRAIVLRSDALPSADGLDVAIARALVHAFQDQRMGGLVASLFMPDGPSDEARVQTCVLEGHASFVAEAMLAARRRESPARASEFATPQGSFAGEVDVPCLEGALFVRDAFARGGWPAVLRAVSSPPPSTEMLVHPNKLDVDFPVRVGLPEWDEERLGAAKLVRDETIGELGVRRLLHERGWNAKEAYAFATGWDGDRLHVYALADGREIVVWRLLWDREADGIEFRNALAPEKDSPPHFWRVAHRGRLVQAVSASDEQLAAHLRDLLGGEEPPAEEAADVASTKEAELHSPP
jgi:hypothetical protein